MTLAVMSNANSLQFPAYNKDGCDFDHLQHLLLAYNVFDTLAIFYTWQHGSRL